MLKYLGHKFFGGTFLLALSFLVASCSGGSSVIDGEIGSDGSYRPGGGTSATQVTFWGWGGSEETEVFTEIVSSFNKKYEGAIKVKYVQRPSTSYGETLLTTLAGNKGPDVFYVQDNFFKQYASLGFLADLTSKYKESTVLDETEMFSTAVSRYRYNIETTTSNPEDPQYGLPKDLAPTAIFYNVSQFEKAGITIISMTEEEAVNAGYTVRGYDPVGKVFNNKVAMSWNDCLQLSNLLMDTKASPYGFFSEWWFNYAWSVGGDCIEYVPTNDPAFNGGRYVFTLNDSSKNYIVKDHITEGVTIGTKTYGPGEIISYTDKALLTDPQKAKCNVLPSQREAFTEFVRLSQPKGSLVDNVSTVYPDTSDFYGAAENGEIKGYGITPSPTAISSDGKVGYFTSGKIGMLFNTVSSVKQIRENMRDEWDVAPALIYKEYSQDGKSVLVHGVNAAHSGSVAMAVNAKSKVQTAAYLFAEYVASPEGQAIQSEAGFAIPLYRSLANSDVFIKEDRAPANISIFIDAAEHQTPGDWWYLKDKKWIDNWANLLNGDVRNAKITLTQFYNHNYYTQTQGLLDAYTKK